MLEKLLSGSNFEAGIPVVRATSGPPSEDAYRDLMKIVRETEFSPIDETQARAMVTGSLRVIGDIIY